jgi:hypothetical protein
MSENTSNNKNVRDDEIDLLDLFRRMGNTIARWGNAIGKALLISIVFLIKKWLPLGLSIILGLTLSVILSRTMTSFYTSDMVLRVNVEPTDEMIAYLNRLHTFCLDENKDHLASAISLTSAQTDNILDIKAYWIIDNGNDKIPDYVDYLEDHDVYDTLNVRMQDRLDIRVKILQPQELSNVRDGILKFINSEPLLIQRNSLRINQNQERLARIAIDIKDLDSLQKFKYFEESRNLLPKSGGQMVFLQEQKTQLLYGDIYKLYDLKNTLEQESALYKDIVTIISDFTVPSERINGGLYYTKTFVPVLFLLTLLILIIRANKKKLHEIYHKY